MGKWLRTIIKTAVVVVGLGLIVGDRTTRSDQWRGALIFCLVAFGLIELLVALRDLRKRGSTWRATAHAAAAAASIATGIALTDTWRWVAASAWVIGAGLLMSKVWPSASADED